MRPLCVWRGGTYHGDTTQHYNTPYLVPGVGGGCCRVLQDLLTQTPRNYTPTHHNPRDHSPSHHSPTHRNPTWHTPKTHTPTPQSPRTAQSQGEGGVGSVNKA